MRRGWIGIGALIGIVPLLASMAPRGDRAGGREDPAGSGEAAGPAGSEDGAGSAGDRKSVV